MKKIGSFEFPETPKEAEAWIPYVRYYALAHRVLVVAKMRVEGTWKAYCDAVSGRDHEAEMERVLQEGDDVGELVARELFGEFEGIPYAR